MNTVLILGGGGMIGQKLARHIRRNGLNGQAVNRLVLHDVAFAPNDERGDETRTGSLADPGAAKSLAALRPDVIFHLAAVVSGEAEQDFDKGWAVNNAAHLALLEALRDEHEKSDGTYCPRFVFSSSIAVFGGPFPDRISDDFLLAPQTSYGAQKAIGELLNADYSRKGFIDGISIRLPTICVRPGKANKAASSFFSGIIREPLNGQPAVLPVPDTVRHWHASPRSAVGFLCHAAALDTGLLQGRRSLNMPGLSCTVAEQIEALRRFAGDDVVALIRREPDEAIRKIVDGWPRDFDPRRAVELGFTAEDSFDDILQVYVEDDLANQ